MPDSFTEEQAHIIKAPFNIDLSLEIRYWLTFTEDNGKTILQLQGEPVHAIEAETAVFRSIVSSIQQGFRDTFEQLVIYLAKSK